MPFYISTAAGGGNGGGTEGRGYAQGLHLHNLTTRMVSAHSHIDMVNLGQTLWPFMGGVFHGDLVYDGWEVVA